MFASAFAVFANCGGSDSSNNGATGGSKADASTGAASGKGGTGGVGVGGSGGIITAGKGGTGGVGGGIGGVGGTGGTAGGTGGASTGGAAGSGGTFSCPTDSGSLSSMMANAICERNIACCSTSKTLLQCESELNSRILTTANLYRNLADSLMNGRSAINCGALEACLTSINGTTCADWPFANNSLDAIPVDDPNCFSVVTPLVATTGTCLENYECIGGYCHSDTMCHAYAGTGSNCSSDPDQQCNPKTSYCDASNHCQLKGGVGTTCSANVQCKTWQCGNGAAGAAGSAGGPSMCEKQTTCYFGPAPGCSVPARGSKAPGGLAWVSLAAIAVALGRRKVSRRRS
jgi:hypothetical protein